METRDEGEEEGERFVEEEIKIDKRQRRKKTQEERENKNKDE